MKNETYIKTGTIKRIHVNQHNIRHNAKGLDQKPVYTVKTSKENIKGYSVDINGASKLVYSPDKPLSCGAKCWVETYTGVTVGCEI
tara:strand:+ start:518 stop:775 length:258 start_codon:yes stop_codon:yes gene_type:complete